jgi:Maltokinase N-terminal cap domain
VTRPRSGPTLTPSFREFMPQWLARQDWYLGAGVPALRPVGAFRLEDPDGEVGIETQLMTDGDEIYQIPMTYRGAALANGALIATAEHSELGARWIYDATTDPVWEAELLRLVQAGGTGGPSGRGGTQEVQARGELLVPGLVLTAGTAAIEVRRVLRPGGPPRGQGIAGVVMGSWHPGGQAEAVTGCLAVVRARSA